MFNNIMVDVETMGKSPDTTHMIQLSAVRFNLETREVSHDFFNRCLTYVPWRYTDDDTFNWWQSKKDVLAGIYSRMEDPAVVMKDFVNWVGPIGYSRFWSKPSHFDWGFVAGYCRDFGQPMPFNYWEAMDMRSFMRGKSWPNTMVEPKPEFIGDAHNALMDCLQQIKVLFTFMDAQEAPDGQD